MNDENLAWKQIDKDIELYKFYIELLIKSAIFIYAITGGVLSYFFSHGETPLMRYSLLAPILFNLGFGLICSLNLREAVKLAKIHKALCGKAKMSEPYMLRALPMMIVFFGVMYFVVAIGVMVLFCHTVPTN